MATALIKAKARDESAGAMLDAIREILGLSESDLADLFRVRAPSVYAGAPPVSGRATRERGTYLGSRDRAPPEIKATRIPQIVRTPDDWLGGKTILETIRDDGPEAVYAYLHRLFAYTGA